MWSIQFLGSSSGVPLSESEAALQVSGFQIGTTVCCPAQQSLLPGSLVPGLESWPRTNHAGDERVLTGLGKPSCNVLWGLLLVIDLLLVLTCLCLPYKRLWEGGAIGSGFIPFRNLKSLSKLQGMGRVRNSAFAFHSISGKITQKQTNVLVLLLMILLK